MELPRHILPSIDPSHHFQFEDSRLRQPLSESAGNAQLHTLASTEVHHDHKGSQPLFEGPPYSLPTVPSQRQSHNIGNTLELRRQNTRKRRQLKFSRNPIVDSSHYRAYRERQTREGDDNQDAKWPDVLEDAFLDALIELPQMQRRKYSFRGKPHGRNELITEYLWIAYTDSLPPGAVPDEEMRRTRKQVSSHIQVLKGFLRDHPAHDLLFPKQKGPKNGFQDSFKDDPCLRALSEGRLPGKRSRRCYGGDQQAQIKPALFMLILKADGNPQGDDFYGGDEVLHEFSRLSPLPRNRTPLESIRWWRERFPLLHRLQTREALKCPIIHMDVSLNLLSSPPSRSSQLISRTLLSIPDHEPRNGEWRIVTTLNKPPELCSDAMQDGRLKDPPIDQASFFVEVNSISEKETIISVPFPAAQFAYVFSCLVSIQQQFEEELKAQSFGRGSDPTIRPAREHVERVSMFQELQSRAAPHAPWVTRSVFIWSFHEAREGESNYTTWGYLDPAPPRRTIMSPSPHPSLQASAVMNENYHNWAEAPLLMQHTNVHDSYGQGLATPPHTAGVQSPFAENGYSFNHQTFDMPGENLSFISNATLESDSSLVDDTAANIESFLSNAHANLADFERNSNGWQLPASESFDTDPAWANYTVPSSTPAVAWDEERKTNMWSEEMLPEESKQLDWVEDTSTKHIDCWEDGSPIKSTVDANYIEQNLEQKLMPWIQNHQNTNANGDIKDDFESVPDARVTEKVQMDMELALSGGNVGRHEDHNITIRHDSIDSHIKEEWHTPMDDRFDYAQLATGLKA